MDVSQDEMIYDECLDDFISYDRFRRGMEMDKFKQFHDEPFITEEFYNYIIESESYREF